MDGQEVREAEGQREAWESAPVSPGTIERDALPYPNAPELVPSVIEKLGEVPDSRITIQEVHFSLVYGAFVDQRSYLVMPPETPEAVMEGWPNQLREHVTDDGRGGYPDALAAHRLVVHLPREGSAEALHELIQDYAEEHFTDQRLLAFYVVHPPHGLDTDSPFFDHEFREHRLLAEGEVVESGEEVLFFMPAERYWHAHILVPIYPLERDGSFADMPHEKWDDPNLLLEWRQEWGEDWRNFIEEQKRQDEALEQFQAMQEVVSGMFVDSPAPYAPDAEEVRQLEEAARAFEDAWEGDIFEPEYAAERGDE